MHRTDLNLMSDRVVQLEIELRYATLLSLWIRIDDLICQN